MRMTDEELEDSARFLEDRMGITVGYLSKHYRAGSLGPTLTTLLRQDVRLRRTATALKEARAWIPDGTGRTPEQRGARAATLTDALEQIDAILELRG